MIGTGFGDTKDEALKEWLEREYGQFSSDYTTTLKEFHRTHKLIGITRSYGRRWEIHYEKRA